MAVIQFSAQNRQLRQKNCRYLLYNRHMRVQVTRTWRNVFKAKKIGDTIYVLANFWLSNDSIKEILRENMQWFAEREKNKVDAANAKNDVAVRQPKEKFQNGAGGCVGTQPSDFASDICKSGNLCDMFCGKAVMYFGEVLQVKSSVSNKTHINDNTLYLSEENDSCKENRLKTIKAFLKKSAKSLLASDFASFGSAVSLCAEKIEFKELKGLWFSCAEATKRIISVDYRMVQLPTMLQKYIIAHCFAHFRYPDHDDDFTKFMSFCIPNYKQCETEIAKYAYLLEI